VKVMAANCSDLARAKLVLGSLLPRVRHMIGEIHYGAWVRKHLVWTIQAVRPPKPPDVSHLTPAQIISDLGAIVSRSFSLAWETLGRRAHLWPGLSASVGSYQVAVRYPTLTSALMHPCSIENYPLVRNLVSEGVCKVISDRLRRTLSTQPLSRDHEGLPATSEAFITLAMSRLTLSRLVPPFP
jgi:hypothetical protein